ncbi:MAG: DNA mismatch repair endonuclease MutL [Phycisphaerae bacterium]|nr:DNA mismatch repair endonuclease MutL [Phycisphaerae bacterium]
MSKIRVLPDLLINQIAAGEVVERPASVVKELVENSIDAGAGRVAITIEDGGKQLIRIADDGEGMTAEDLHLAITPHATSKLSCEADLYSVVSMGFRGEALASIGAVSNLRITSRKRGTIEGHQITVSGEEVRTSGAAGCPEGTTVEVRDLFFNVPARRKFLRTRSTETGHVNEQFARLALGFPDVGLELINNVRAVHNFPAGQSIRERIGSLYGAELAGELILIERQERDLVIEGYAAPPIRSRSTTSWQYIFVNGRYVRDRFVQHAVREAYRGLMEHDRQPVYFLFLTVAPENVDVNVHPTKIEVRWRESSLIHSQVLAAFRDTFLQTDLTPTLQPQQTDTHKDPIAVRHQMADLLRSAEPVVGDSAPAAFADAGPPREAAGDGGGAPGSGGTARYAAPGGSTPADGTELWRSVYADTAHPPQDSAPSGSPQTCGTTRPSRAIQLHNTYLVVEADDGMLIIDQHALHERVLYNQFCRRITSGPLESQRLLLPETLAVTPKQIALLQGNGELLHQLGIEVTPFGHDTVAIQSFPVLLKDADVRPFMRDLLDKLQDQEEHGKVAHTETVIHALLDMMACKAAVKAGDPLTSEEIDALVAQRYLVEKSSNCPHGRPTTLKLTIKDLEKQFKRV